MDNYNFLDNKLDNKFDFNFEKDNKKKDDNLKENYIERSVFNDNLEYNTLKPHHFSFKYSITFWLAYYFILKASYIEFLLSFNNNLKLYYFSFKYGTKPRST